ncbi:MAG: N-acetylmuramoyl-L-alanine amidase [candidate division KSB1 bacterium]|nr:N-acetylmuramoyl-L-alanine amidase [candidate division KSB1 bacterium]MDZ7366345.1 N-acetylmuramoyl-L-alanine amidase [candidate division KSB1 bacterium]MDZ7404000.1 N-acetylmuramoyl-L-alanine amidase [candidate division KSB1 bacterium]
MIPVHQSRPVFFFFLFFPVLLFSQNLSGLSICLDPGHGPGNANAGPTGLREADINFRVAVFLKEYLKAANVDTVLLTHLNNTTDISLSAREQIANNFGVTWFHSVHHNATGVSNSTARYTLLLLEERRNPGQPCPNGSASGTGQADWPGQADVMSNIMARRIWEAYRTSNYLTRLDWTFYGGCNGGFSLGVLNDLQMPGELSEATFHDNRLEEAKMRNNDFLRMEARALAMSFFDYFNAGTMPTGALVGIVSNSNTGAPLDGITVTLNPGHRTYTTDNWKNGLYVFDGLLPGDYTISISAAGFRDFSRTVKVTAHAFGYGDAPLIPAITAVGDKPSAMPSTIRLEQNFPNPFYPKTVIRYFIPHQAPVQIAIVDPLGRLVRKLTDGMVESGEHHVQWDGLDEKGVAVASGIYFIKIRSGDFSATRKLVLAR